GDEPLAKVAQKVVVTRLRFLGHEPTASVSKSLLHLQAWINAEDVFEVASLERLNAETAVVETDPHRRLRHFRLLVQCERRRRIQRHQVADQLGTAIRKTLAPDKRQGSISAVHLEAIDS